MISFTKSLGHKIFLYDKLGKPWQGESDVHAKIKTLSRLFFFLLPLRPHLS